MQLCVQYKNQPIQPVILPGNPSHQMLKSALDVMAQNWCKSKAGRKARRLGDERILYYSDGKMAGSVFIDPLPNREPVAPRKGAKTNPTQQN